MTRSKRPHLYGCAWEDCGIGVCIDCKTERRIYQPLVDKTVRLCMPCTQAGSLTALPNNDRLEPEEEIVIVRPRPVPKPKPVSVPSDGLLLSAPIKSYDINENQLAVLRLLADNGRMFSGAVRCDRRTVNGLVKRGFVSQSSVYLSITEEGRIALDGAQIAA